MRGEEKGEASDTFLRKLSTLKERIDVFKQLFLNRKPYYIRIIESKHEEMVHKRQEEVEFKKMAKMN